MIPAGTGETAREVGRAMAEAVPGLFPRRPGLGSGSVHVRFMVGKVTLRQVSLRALGDSFIVTVRPVPHIHSSVVSPMLYNLDN
jgi:hypothetical protein